MVKYVLSSTCNYLLRVINMRQCIQFYQLLVGMRTFKINRINLSPQMFDLQDENDHILQPRTITPYLKRFNLNNQRYIKIANFNHIKFKKYSLRSQQSRNSINTPQINHQQQMRQMQQKSKLGKYSSQLQGQHSSLSKSQLTTSQTYKTYHRPKIYQIMHRNKTEQDECKFTSNLIWKKWEDQHYNAKGTSGKVKWKDNKDMGVASVARQRYFPAHNIMNKSIKDRAPLSKYKKSILRSYRIKTIQLMGPQDSNKTATKFKTTLPYFIDLANDDNLKQIHLQDLRKIQTQQYPIRHRKMLSSQPNSTFYKHRPSTSKISQKPQDFQPCPWDYQQRQEQSQTKDDLLQF